MSLRPHRRLTLSALLLGFALVFAQVVLTYHSESFDQHKPGDKCELCVVSAHFAHGMAASDAPALPLLHGLVPDARPLAVIRGGTFLAYRGRAPPVLSRAFLA